jgi:hypothetical protein
MAPLIRVSWPHARAAVGRRVFPNRPPFGGGSNQRVEIRNATNQRLHEGRQ